MPAPIVHVGSPVAALPGIGVSASAPNVAVLSAQHNASQRRRTFDPAI
jgi:hypothetical protein